MAQKKDDKTRVNSRKGTDSYKEGSESKGVHKMLGEEDKKVRSKELTDKKLGELEKEVEDLKQAIVSDDENEKPKDEGEEYVVVKKKAFYDVAIALLHSPNKYRNSKGLLEEPELARDIQSILKIFEKEEIIKK